MLSQGRGDRLWHLCGKFYVNVREFYSGKATVSTATSWLNSLFISKQMSSVPAFHTTHAADCDPVSQLALLSHQHPGFPEYGPTCRCVFGGFTTNRLSRAHREEVLDLEPDEDEADLEKSFHDWKKQGDLLFSNPSKYLPADAEDWCLRHKDMCSVFQTIQEETVQSLEITLPALPKRKEITLVTGGTTCTDFAGYGGRSGEAGKSMKAMNAFCCDVLASEPEIWCTEISGADLGYYRSRVGHKYFIEGIHIDAAFANGGRRNRLFAWGAHWRKTRYHGSAHRFAAMMQRKRLLTGRDYFVEPASGRLREARARAKVSGNFFHRSETDPIPIPMQLTALQLARYYEHKAAMINDWQHSNNADVVGVWLPNCRLDQ